MGKRGPAKKPPELEALHGNPGHRKSSAKLQFDKPEEIPKPPVWLGSIAKKEWKRLAPLVYGASVLTDADIAVFAGYCASYEQWVLAERAIQAKKPDAKTPTKLTYTTDSGMTKTIPEISIANDAKKQMLLFAREFGLTPSARANITAVETEEADSSIMDFIKIV